MDHENEINQAIELIKSGQAKTATRLLINLLKIDRKNINAWLWLSVCMERIEDKRRCLEEVLIIDPENKKAQIALEKLKGAANPSVEELFSYRTRGLPKDETSETRSNTSSINVLHIHSTDQIGTTKNKKLDINTVLDGLEAQLSNTKLFIVGLFITILFIICIGGAFIKKRSYQPSVVSNLQIATLERTVIRKMPSTWTPSPSSSPQKVNPTSTPGNNKPKKSIFTGEAKSYLPNDTDIPKFYSIQTAASGPFNPHFPDGVLSAYALALQNPNVDDYFSKSMAVLMQVVVFETIEQADKEFEYDASNLDRGKDPPLVSVKRYDDMPNADEAQLLLGNKDEGPYYTLEVRLIFRKANVEVMVIVIGGVETDADFEKVGRDRVQDAKYYADLIAAKIK